MPRLEHLEHFHRRSVELSGQKSGLVVSRSSGALKRTGASGTGRTPKSRSRAPPEPWRYIRYYVSGFIAVSLYRCCIAFDTARLCEHVRTTIQQVSAVSLSIYGTDTADTMYRFPYMVFDTADTSDTFLLTCAHRGISIQQDPAVSVLYRCCIGAVSRYSDKHRYIISDVSPQGSESWHSRWQRGRSRL